MENRFQAVWIDHMLSDWININIGVPQGSILGPLFFILFANDLPDSVNSELDEYADDSTMTESDKNIIKINTNMTESCNQVKDWMIENRLCLNADKTKLLIAGTSKRLKNLDEAQINILIDEKSVEKE